MVTYHQSLPQLTLTTLPPPPGWQGSPHHALSLVRCLFLDARLLLGTTNDNRDQLGHWHLCSKLPESTMLHLQLLDQLFLFLKDLLDDF